MSRDWRQFWARQDDPRHPRNASDFFLIHGRELALIVGDPSGKRILEYGCGSGALFETIGFNRALSYRGVDFSEKMLSAFRSEHPAVDTVCADASNYRDDAKYDLIFSNAVVQYFDRAMVRQHIANASRMLMPGGRLVIGSIPWQGARAAFHLQAYSPQRERRFARGLAVLARSYLGVDPIGHWHSYREFSAVSERHGLKTEFFGCIQYPYRFHVRMESAA